MNTNGRAYVGGLLKTPVLSSRAGALEKGATRRKISRAYTLGMTFSGLFFLLLSPLVAHARQMDDQGIAVLRMIDKLSARSSTFDVPVDKTVKFGSRLFIKVRACRKASQLDAPESASFLQIWEKAPGAEESQWIFSGWMFASRPSASAMDHPVYDVWLIECKNAATAAAPLSTEAVPATAMPAATDQAEKPVSEVEKRASEKTVITPEEKEKESSEETTAPAETEKNPSSEKVFDPAAIRRDLENNAGGGVSDGEDAVAAPEEESDH
jgi:hypothetical protein